MMIKQMRTMTQKSEMQVTSIWLYDEMKWRNWSCERMNCWNVAKNEYAWEGQKDDCLRVQYQVNQTNKEIVRENKNM